MKLTEDIAGDILAIDTIKGAVIAITTYSIEDPTLSPIVQQVVYGTKLKFHYMRIESGMYRVDEKAGEITIDGKIYKLEAVWDELDNRISLAKKALLDRVTEPSKYKPR